ncbi:MAG: glycosyltransferase family 39 protein [Actinobacteria bacterium]|nr:glycosyltransferase family 39 protein [Actinomycetota bacterium]MBI3686598.1 glycosyltransferase family 39 protein [Actinomycetota bacterium]
MSAVLTVVDAHARRIARAAAGLYLVAGTAYAIALGDTLRYYDEQVYLQLARTLVDHGRYSLDGVSSTAYRPPGYPFLLAGVDALGGGIVAMRLLGVLALAGSVLLAYRLGVRVHGRVAGAVAAVLMAGYPLLVFTAGTLYPQVHAMALLLLGLEWSLRATETAGRRRAGFGCGAGLSWGLMILAVPTFAVSVLLIGGWLLWRHRPAAWRVLPVLALSAAVLPGAWCVRNAVVLHAFVPVSTNNGINLILGNSEHVTAGGGRVGDISAYESAAQRLGLSEVQLDRYYRQAATRWVADHPGSATRLYAGKVVNNFSYHNELATSGQNSTAKDLVSALSFYPLLLLFGVRAVRWRRLRSLERLLIVLVLGNVLLLAVFYTRLRFRVPLDGIMLISSAAALAELARRWWPAPVPPGQGTTAAPSV